MFKLKPTPKEKEKPKTKPKWSPITASEYSRRLHPKEQTGRIKISLEEQRQKAIAAGHHERSKVK